MHSKPQGKMIVCDGSNGAGKSTVLSAIESHLSKRSTRFITTREPGGTSIGEKIRELLLDNNNSEMCATAELLLFAAARSQHFEEKIKPALDSNSHVISDRFESASVSFQHHARGLPIDIINQLNEIAIGQFRPHMTIILDLDPKIGLERVYGRGKGLDRMEDVEIEFLERARSGYIAQAKQFPERFSVVDASQALEDVIKETLSIVDHVIA